jgi:hypothetical protein
VRRLLAMPTGTEAASDAANASDLVNTFRLSSSDGEEADSDFRMRGSSAARCCLWWSSSESAGYHAILGMGIGLYVFWIIIGGLLMWWLREPIGNFVQRIPRGWTIKFIVFATALAMLEEVVTVAMTNTAPLYDVAMAPAHVTGSANYWDVVLTSSVVLLWRCFASGPGCRRGMPSALSRRF